jgi:hypothetical protein
MIIKIPSSHIFQKEVDPILILKHIIHAQEKRMNRLKEYFFLVFGVLYLLLIDKYIFIDSLHGIQFSIKMIHNEKDFAERTFINDLPYLEIFKPVSLFLLRHPCSCNQ